MKFFYLFSIYSLVSAYKIAILSPDIANSDVLFCKKIGETLAAAGHDVTIVLYQSFVGTDSSDVRVRGNVKVHQVDASIGIHRNDWDNAQASVIFDDVGQFDQRMFQHFQKYLNMLTETCRRLVQNNSFLSWLKEEKFDLAFTTHYHACPIGLVHYAKIPSWIWLQTGHLQEYVSHAVGNPIIPSYVPPAHLDLLDKMPFSERMLSFLMHTMGKNFYPNFIANIETNMFREEIDPNFPDLVELGKKCPLVMVNSNELYELPRPTIAKVVNIGGLGYSQTERLVLPEPYYNFANTGKEIILVSLGTVAPSHLIPEHWKEAFIGAFKKLPDYNFIYKYDGDDLEDKVPANVLVTRWMPQAALLKNKNVKTFLTHAGYNSLQEAITFGKPLVTIGLFGDQPKNAKIAVKHGFAVNLSKGNITVDSVYEAFKKVIEDPSYLASASRLSAMVSKRPVPPEQLLVKWTEFVAEFQTLENLVPAGTKLNVFQYYSLDVISFLFAVVGVVLFLVWKLLSCFVRCIFCRKGKKDKKE